MEEHRAATVSATARHHCGARSHKDLNLGDDIEFREKGKFDSNKLNCKQLAVEKRVCQVQAPHPMKPQLEGGLARNIPQRAPDNSSAVTGTLLRHKRSK
jgi:hypothetical protein